MSKQAKLALRVRAVGLLAVALALSSCAGPAAPSPAQPTAPAQLSTHDHLYVREGYGSPAENLVVIDAATGAREQELPLGVPSPDWSTLYTAEHGKGSTTVRAIEVKTGRTVRQTQIGGEYDLTYVDIDGKPGGLSPDGHWLVLSPAFTNAPASQPNRFAVLDTASSQPPRLVTLDNNFWFDAISNDGSALYLVERLSTANPASYQVRLYDLVQGKLLPDAIADKTDTEVMSGYRLSSIASLDGKWLYSLYGRNSEGPFIHALNLTDRFAVCIDLPSQWRGEGEKELQWSLAMTADGKTLYAVNAALGFVAQVDTAQLSVQRTATLPAPSAVAPNLLARLAQWLAPTAEAKRILIGGAALSPDGRTLFALGETGLLVVNTSDLALRGRYLKDWALDSLALSPDGTRLYVVSAEHAKIVQLDPATGMSVAEIAGASHPWGIWHTTDALTGSTVVSDDPPATCPITQPPEPPYVPPPPYPPNAPFAREFWYGSEALWTSLNADGTWRELPHNTGGYTQKVFWWRKGYSWTDEPEPELSVTGRRLDASAPPLHASKATNAFAPDIQSAMLVGVDVPTPGCWEITGRYGGRELSFTVWVAPH